MQQSNEFCRYHSDTLVSKIINLLYILFKDLLLTYSDLKLSVFWKIKKEGSGTKLAFIKTPLVMEWHVFENAAKRFPIFGQES